jgi:hypothetical protein
LAIPDSRDPGRPSDHRGDGPMLYVGAVGSQGVVPQSRLGAGRLLIALCQACQCSCVTAVRSAISSPRAITVNLLCDRARHERSGVQLI